MSSYESSVACKMLATHCCVCGRPLVDAISVALGIGPDCREGHNGGISPETQNAANKLTYHAAIAATAGRIEEVRQYAQALELLGLTTLANKVASRFVNAERHVKVRITMQGNEIKVSTPFRRGDKENFLAAWRAIPGRRFDRKDNCNVVPASQKEAVWELLKQFFPGDFAIGPKGLFRIPA